MKKSSDAQPSLEPAALERTLRSVVRAEIAKAQSELLSLKQVAEFLQVKRATVTKLVREERLPVRYISERKRMVLRSELLTWIQTRSPSAELEEQPPSSSTPNQPSAPGT